MKTNNPIQEGDITHLSTTVLPFQKEAYVIIGLCMEVHSQLGSGFLEVVYKDALEYEFQCHGIPYEREKRFEVPYKSIILPRRFNVDFQIYNEIILEIKAQHGLLDEFYRDVLNYLKASHKSLGLLINFGEESLRFKRIIRSK